MAVTTTTTTRTTKRTKTTTSPRQCATATSSPSATATITAATASGSTRMARSVWRPRFLRDQHRPGAVAVFPLLVTVWAMMMMEFAQPLTGTAAVAAAAATGGTSPSSAAAGGVTTTTTGGLPGEVFAFDLETLAQQLEQSQPRYANVSQSRLIQGVPVRVGLYLFSHSQTPMVRIDYGCTRELGVEPRWTRGLSFKVGLLDVQGGFYTGPWIEDQAELIGCQAGQPPASSSSSSSSSSSTSTSSSTRHMSFYIALEKVRHNQLIVEDGMLSFYVELVKAATSAAA